MNLHHHFSGTFGQLFSGSANMMLSLIGIAVLGGQVYGDRAANIRDEIQNTYAGYARAVLRRNIDDTMGYLTPDIVWVQRGRRNDREQIRKSMLGWEQTTKDGSKF